MLSKEYVIFSGHHGHDGVRSIPGNDSVFNGADDNASVSVALLAIAEGFSPSAWSPLQLFSSGTALKKRVAGFPVVRRTSYYVPKTSIVAVLNGDMIGRNSPDSAALLGVQPPHRNSRDLVAIALAANAGRPALSPRHPVRQAHPDRRLVFPQRPPALCKSGYPGTVFHLPATPGLSYATG